MSTGSLRMKIVTRTWGDRTVHIGKAFLNEKGIDGEFWALPIANREGKYLFSIVGDDGAGPAASGLRLKILLPVAYVNQQREQKTQWTHIGAAAMADVITGELYVLPLPNRPEGVVRFVMREEDGKPAQPQGGYQAPRGQGAGKFAQQPRPGGYAAPQGAPGGPQAPQGGGLRPNHRDGLSQPVYGGAAASQGAQTGWDLSGFGEDDSEPPPF